MGSKCCEETIGPLSRSVVDKCVHDPTDLHSDERKKSAGAGLKVLGEPGLGWT